MTYTFEDLESLREAASKEIPFPAIYGPKPEGLDADDIAKLHFYRNAVEERVRTYILAGLKAPDILHQSSAAPLPQEKK